MDRVYASVSGMWWARVESDGTVNVFRRDGVWLGWTDSQGQVQSVGGLEREQLAPLVYAVASEALAGSRKVQP